MVFCTQCGTQGGEGARFCASCGSPLADPSTQTVTNQGGTTVIITQTSSAPAEDHPHRIDQTDASGGWRCDKCSTSYSGAPRFRCSSGCDFDLCFACVKVSRCGGVGPPCASVASKFTHNHPLSEISRMGYRCDGCGQHDRGKRFRCTANCDYDLCEVCVEMAEFPAPPTSAAATAGVGMGAAGGGMGMGMGMGMGGGLASQQAAMAQQMAAAQANMASEMAMMQQQMAAMMGGVMGGMGGGGGMAGGGMAGGGMAGGGMAGGGMGGGGMVYNQTATTTTGGGGGGGDVVVTVKTTTTETPIPGDVPEQPPPYEAAPPGMGPPTSNSAPSAGGVAPPGLGPPPASSSPQTVTVTAGNAVPAYSSAPPTSSVTVTCSSTSSGGGVGRAMSQAQFDEWLGRLEGESFSSGKIGVVESAVASLWFSSDQARLFVEALSFDSDKVKAAIALHPKIVDKQNFERVIDSISFSSSKDEVRAAVS